MLSNWKNLQVNGLIKSLQSGTPSVFMAPDMTSLYEPCSLKLWFIVFPKSIDQGQHVHWVQAYPGRKPLLFFNFQHIHRLFYFRIQLVAR